MMDANRIAPKLWMGSCPNDDACSHFDAIVLCAVELQDLPLPCRHKVVKAPLDDARPTRQEVGTALRAAREVNALRHRGRRVLVSCAMGINRSGLVTALALVLDGVPARKAISLVREKRRPPADIDLKPLNNRHFVELVELVGRRREAR